jgi:hypothetical protein
MIDEKIYVLGTIHLNHDKNPNYGYDELIAAIEVFKPEVIGVEIRPQDMQEDNGYLTKYYPPEMVQVKALYEAKLPIYGFDWRGQSIEKERIERWLTDVPNLKTLMGKYEDIALLIKQRKILMEPFYKTCTLEQCQKEYNSHKEALDSIDEKLNSLLMRYGNSELIQYNQDRENHIGVNVAKIINNHANQRIMIVTGIEHKLHVTTYLSLVLGVC